MSKLTHIFSSVLGVPEAKVTAELSPANTASWDSLNAIILLTEIEKAFDTRFEYKEAMAIKNFGDVEKLVASKGKDPQS
jgi:acyl carrier protein